MKTLLTGLLCMLLSSFLIGQTSVTLVAAADNTLYAEGGSNGAGDYFFAGRTNGGSTRRAVLRFDLSGLPPGITITSASLKLNCSRAAGSSGGVAVRRLSNSWGEGSSNANANEGQGATATPNDATWQVRFTGVPNTNWNNAGGDFDPSVRASVAGVSAGEVINLNSQQLVDDVQAWANNPNNNFGWLLEGNEAQTGTARRYDSREHPVAANRPSLQVSYQVLPVQLHWIKTRVAGSRINLLWASATENHFDSYLVQHSRNGRNFETIGEMKGRYASGGEYRYEHEGPGQGQHYYRLSQRDADGSFSYSAIVVARMGQAEKRMSLYPNPAHSTLLVALPEWKNQAYRITNPAGRLVQAGRLYQQQLNIAALPAGIYLLQVSNENGKWESEPFLKQ